MKWFFALLALLAIGWFVYHQRNSVKTSYVNGLPEYSMMPGREYVVERDCYIFTLKNKKNDWPFIGANAPDAALSVAALPTEVTDKNIGRELPEAHILDVVRTGSRFKIASVRRDVRDKQTSITFEILFLDETERRYARLDAYWIIDHSRDNDDIAPTILESYAVPRVKK
ncbi:MAG TPA: hypothetical protein VIM69_04870 [Opitutaceae bacterium]